jgi:FAD/FMN-containing dehydrogenase
MPFLPEEYHGKPVVMGLMAYAGAAEEADGVFAPFRALAEPIADLVRPIPYPEIYGPEEPDYRPIAFTRTGFTDGVDRQLAETILERIQASTAMMAVTQIRVLGGAMARVRSEATAFAHRDKRIMVNVVALAQSPDELPQHEPWVASLLAEVTQGDAGAYVGFLADEGEDRIRAAYPEATWDRLRRVKAQYDPDNVFRLNQNIAPGVGA